MCPLEQGIDVASDQGCWETTERVAKGWSISGFMEGESTVAGVRLGIVGCAWRGRGVRSRWPDPRLRDAGHGELGAMRPARG
jgi:hypothetical protein